MITDFGSHAGSEASVSLGPNLISWECSAAVVVFLKTLSLSEAAELSNLNLQASNLDI